MTDSAIRRLTAAAVLIVALIAAVVSFVHIEHLAAVNGQTMLAAYLLPLSIDGTVVNTHSSPESTGHTGQVARRASSHTSRRERAGICEMVSDMAA